MALHLPRLATPGKQDIAKFRESGFLVVPNVLSDEQIETLRAAIPNLSAGQFLPRRIFQVRIGSCSQPDQDQPGLLKSATYLNYDKGKDHGRLHNQTLGSALTGYMRACA
jgi:hypothetical protein